MSKPIYTKVAGVTFENEDGRTRQRIIKKMTEDDYIRLEPEPDNREDPNAIAVVVLLDDDPWGDEFYKIGYLNGGVAKELTEKTAKGYQYSASIIEITGEGKENRGVNIEIMELTPDEVAKNHADYEAKEFAKKQAIEKENKRLKFPKTKWWQWVFGLPLILMFMLSIFVWSSFSDFLISLIFFLGIGLLFFIPQIIALIKWGSANRKK